MPSQQKNAALTWRPLLTSLLSVSQPPVRPSIARRGAPVDPPARPRLLPLNELHRTPFYLRTPRLCFSSFLLSVVSSLMCVCVSPSSPHCVGRPLPATAALLEAKQGACLIRVQPHEVMNLPETCNAARRSTRAALRRAVLESERVAAWRAEAECMRTLPSTDRGALQLFRLVFLT